MNRREAMTAAVAAVAGAALPGTTDWKPKQDQVFRSAGWFVVSIGPITRTFGFGEYRVDPEYDGPMGIHTLK